MPKKQTPLDRRDEAAKAISSLAVRLRNRSALLIDEPTNRRYRTQIANSMEQMAILLRSLELAEEEARTSAK